MFGNLTPLKQYLKGGISKMASHIVVQVQGKVSLKNFQQPQHLRLAKECSNIIILIVLCFGHQNPPIDQMNYVFHLLLLKEQVWYQLQSSVDLFNFYNNNLQGRNKTRSSSFKHTQSNHFDLKQRTLDNISSSMQGRFLLSWYVCVA